MLTGTGLPQSIAVVGGTSDIALAIIARIGADTRRTMLTGRDPLRLTKAATLVGEITGGVVIERECDLARLDESRAAINSGLDELGEVDLGIIAAGELPEQELTLAEPEAMERLIAVNFSANASAGLEIFNRMKSQGHGVLVVLSSVAAARPRPSNFAYGSTKAGLDAFFEGLSYEGDRAGVLVVLVRPAFVHTRMTKGLEPAPFSATPEDVAEATATAIRERRHIVSVPGPLRVLSTALKVVPRPIVEKLDDR